jgi:Holliday junction resolvasome RuvABC endonuclease subunit
MIYIGIDPSLTGTGIVILDETGHVLDKDLISTKAKDPIEERLTCILDQITDLIGNSDAKTFCIEGLSYGSKSASMLELAGLHYLIRRSLYFDGDLIILPPQSLKKWVCGKGNVKKEQMLLQAYKKFGLEFQDNNICDAYCLARYAMEGNKPEDKKTKTRMKGEKR